MKMLISLIPWVAFTLLAGHAGAGAVGWAAALAGLLTVAIVAWGMRERAADGSRRRLKVIDAAGILTFAAMAALAFTGSPALREHIADYGRGSCALILALVMLSSLLVVPFTEQYARESVPRPYWHSPVFRAVNRRISAAFGVAVLVAAACHLYAGYLGAHASQTHAASLALNWVIPALAILAAINYTRTRTALARKSA
ncbi:MAG: hypothetical protein ACRDP6_36070 [Actinoallomurus sp.]